MKSSTELGFAFRMHRINSLARMGPLSFDQILDLVGYGGHACMILFLSAPFLQPIPLLGLSTPFGICMGIVGVFWVLGRPPQLPRRIRQTLIPSATLLKVSQAAEYIAKKMERWVKPRPGLFLNKKLARMHGLVICFQSLLLSLPLPVPFSNALPAWTLALLCLGWLEQDSRVIALSYAVGLISVLFFASLVILPYYGIRLL